MEWAFDIFEETKETASADQVEDLGEIIKGNV